MNLEPRDRNGSLLDGHWDMALEPANETGESQSPRKKSLRYFFRKLYLRSFRFVGRIYIGTVVTTQAALAVPLLFLHLRRRSVLRFRLLRELATSITASAFNISIARRVYAHSFISEPVNMRIMATFDPMLAEEWSNRSNNDLVSETPLDIQIIVRAASLLKWSGYLKAARLLYIYLLRLRSGSAVACIELADLTLLAANWEWELLQYRKQQSWIDITEVFPGLRGNALCPRSDPIANIRRAAYFLKRLSQLSSSQKMKASASMLCLRLKQCAEWNPRYVAVLDEIGLPDFRPDADLPYAIGHIQAIARDRSINNQSDSSYSALQRIQIESRYRRRSRSWCYPRPTRIDPARRNKYLRSLEVVPLQDLADKLKQPVLTMPSQNRQRYRIRIATRGLVKDFHVDRNLPRTISCDCDNVVDIGYGMMVVDDRFLAIDTKHVPHSQAQLFCPAIWHISTNEALVELDRTAESFNNELIYPVIGHNNYYHWLIETIGDLAAELESGSQPGLTTYRNLSGYQRDMLALFFPEQQIAEQLPPYPQQYRMKRARLMSRHARDQIPRIEGIAAIRKRAEAYLSSFRSFSPDTKRVYLYRKGTKRLDLANSQDVLQYMARRGFAVVDSGSLSIDEQINLFSSCDVVAGVGGAALANVAFCRPGTKILVFGPETGAFDTFGALSHAAQCPFWLCLGQVKCLIVDPHLVWTQQEFSMNLDDIDMCLEEMGI
jgi:hypothetical protein